MKNTCPNKNQRGSGLIVLILVTLLIVAAVFIYMRQQSVRSVEALPTLPPVAERTNPAPTSGYTVSVGDVKPGNTLLVDAVDVSQPASLVVVLDSAHPQTLGKSAVLTAGSHTAVSINLSPATKDGDVVIVRLVDANGKTIVNADKQPVEVKKNVGQLMTHYSNEY